MFVLFIFKAFFIAFLFSCSKIYKTYIVIVLVRRIIRNVPISVYAMMNKALLYPNVWHLFLLNGYIVLPVFVGHCFFLSYLYMLAIHDLLYSYFPICQFHLPLHSIQSYRIGHWLIYHLNRNVLNQSIYIEPKIERKNPFLTFYIHNILTTETGEHKKNS